MTYDTVTYKRKGKIAYIKLNRPQVLNAFNDQLYKDLEDAFSEFDTDEKSWVCIVQGAGRCFSAGGDMKEPFRNNRPKNKGGLHTTHPYESFLLNTINWKPVIAAVHSYCLGVGLDFALQCDLITASEDAQFGITEIKRGMAGGAASGMLRWFMPSKVASEMALTGENLSAAEFYRLGLVNRLTRAGEHLLAAEELAQRILKAPPLAVRAEVRMNRYPLIERRTEALLQARALQLNSTEDFKESVKALSEKRPPIYRGR